MLTPEQAEARRGYVGGSDIGRILFGEANEVATEKWGIAKPFVGNNRVDWGNELEPVIIGYWLKSMSVFDKMREADQDDCPRELSIENGVPDFGFPVGGNVDFWAANSRPPLKVHGLEVKTAGIDQADRWGESCVISEVLSGVVPIEYECQCRWYMMLGEQEVWHLAVLIGGNDYRAYRITRDHWADAAMLAAAKAFWRAVEALELPSELDGGDGSKAWLKWKYGETTGEIIPAPPAIDRAVWLWQRGKRRAKAIDKVMRKAEARIRETIGKAAGIRGGDYEVTWNRKNNTTYYKELSK
jgi:hypothetical protein